MTKRELPNIPGAALNSAKPTCALLYRKGRMGMVTVTFIEQPEVGDDPAAHITLHFGRACPAARH
jgi:hypothetical protein